MKALDYVLGACAIAILLGAGLYYFGPAFLRSSFTTSLQNNKTLSSPSISITVLGQGSNASAITNRINYRITNAADLQNLWLMVYGEDDSHPVPTIDFTKNEVLGVFDGTHATDGYSITVKSVVDQDPVRTVTIEHDSPIANCKEPSAQISPFELVEVHSTTLSISHIDTTGSSPCLQ
jgi:hypothetical protein